MRSVKIHIVGLLSLFACANIFGQSTSQSDGRTTFHISGRVTSLGRAVPDQWVTFEGPIRKFVQTDSAGHYEAALPLGVWEVAVTDVQGPTETSLSRPRLVRVTTPDDVTLDLFVRNGILCSIAFVTFDGGPPTEEEVERTYESCAGLEFFSVPSNDGVPFEVIVGGPTHGLLSLMVENDSGGREFGTYNLLAVQADRVVFTPFAGGGLLVATGSVVVNDKGREYRRNSIRFLIGGGQAIESY